MHYYFAYGANTNIANMSLRCPDAHRIGRAWIDGYAFRWRGVADIEISSDEYVVGVLWQIHDGDLAALDEFEGYPHVYFRQRVIINHGDAQHVGWAYMMIKQDTESSPGDAYRDMVYEGYAQNDLADGQLTQALERFN